MQIAASNMTLAAAYERTHAEEEKSSLHVWDDRARQQRQNRMQTHQKQLEPIASEHKTHAKKMEEAAEAVLADPKLRAIVLALEILTGKKIRIETFDAATREHDITPHQRSAKSVQDGPRREGWGIDFSYEKTTVTTQSLAFSASGSVTLDDGRRIDLSLAFSMQSEQVLHERFSFKAGDALIDPLVVNFDGGTLELGSVHHNFDLNLDGEIDEIAFAGEGSGFLALDKDRDGQINDGSELFGPTEGDGFKELAAYDDDANGWIDEADSIFSNLRIWTKEASGKEHLYTLKEKGIGAIYLQNAATEFDYVNNFNAYDGKLRASSIFLKEDGGAGTVQEVDLKI